MRSGGDSIDRDSLGLQRRPQPGKAFLRAGNIRLVGGDDLRPLCQFLAVFFQLPADFFIVLRRVAAFGS